MSRTVLITGGSRGIGLALSREFAARGDRLLWASRDEAEIDAGKAALKAGHPGTPMDGLALDLADPGAPQAVAEWALAKAQRIDVLVNNAGFGAYGPSKDIDYAREQAMIAVNVSALHGLTRAFIPVMEAAGGGAIVNIASNSAFQPAPGLAVYAASKAFVKHYSEALSAELKAAESPVRVMTVCPAAVKDTDFKTDAEMAHIRTFDSIATTTAAEVAGDIVRGLDEGRDFVLTGAAMRRSYWLMKILPAPAVKWLVRRELEVRQPA